MLIQLSQLEYHEDQCNAEAVRDFVLKTIMTNLNIFSDQFISIFYHENDETNLNELMQLLKSIPENVFNADI